MSYAIRKDNLGWRAVNSPDDCAGDEYFSEIQPEAVQPSDRELVNLEARAYLTSTDWYIIRKQETGQEIPEEILATRAEARSKVIEV